MLRDNLIFPGLIQQKVTHRVMQAEQTPTEIEVQQQRKIVKPREQIFRLELIEPTSRAPHLRDQPNRRIGIFGKDSKFAKARALSFRQQFQTNRDGARNGFCAIQFLTRIEGDETFGVEPFVDASYRL
ncbi:hypothetical protein [Methylocystis sp.]|uniref:hypothetical protein n=1 Tax=Methylocystis sp. TaxID=1911079 RepID=UPI003DA5681D